MDLIGLKVVGDKFKMTCYIDSISGVDYSEIFLDHSEKDIKKRVSNLISFIKDKVIVGYDVINTDLKIVFDFIHNQGFKLSFSKLNIIDLKEFQKSVNPITYESALSNYTKEDVFNGDDVTGEYEVKSYGRILEGMVNKHRGEIVKGHTIDSKISVLKLVCNPRFSSLDLDGKILNSNNGYLFNFGKHKGKCVYDVFSNIEPDYFNQLLLDETLSEDTLDIVKLLYKRVVHNAN